MTTKKEVPKCAECPDKMFAEYNGSPSRYYCSNKIACKAHNVGMVKICNCDRGKSVLKIKTSPRWCPRRDQIDPSIV